MFNIIVDTREQTPWTFSSASVGEIKHQKLDTGDYSIEGLEDVLCIERKKSVAEIAGNVTDKRFTRELERMAKFRFKFLILEFDYYSIDIFPQGSGIPKPQQAKIKISGSYIMKVLSEIQTKYDIHVVTCMNDKYAEHVAINIMKRVSEIIENERK